MEEEAKLWVIGIFDINDPVGLQRAVFFYIAKRRGAAKAQSFSFEALI